EGGDAEITGPPPRARPSGAGPVRPAGHPARAVGSHPHDDRADPARRPGASLRHLPRRRGALYADPPLPGPARGRPHPPARGGHPPLDRPPRRRPRPPLPRPARRDHDRLPNGPRTLPLTLAG